MIIHKTNLSNQNGISPPEIHPDMESGMGMATKLCLGTDSSWLKVEIVQIMLEQVIKYILFCTPRTDEYPPIIACPWINGTMA